VEETLRALSSLADALVSGAFAVAAAEVRAEAGLPLLRAGARSGFAVLALGKLGGSELNFSSDVDLVYLHRTDSGFVSRRSGSVTLHAHAEALGRRITAVLGARRGSGSRSSRRGMSRVTLSSRGRCCSESQRSCGSVRSTRRRCARSCA
jgi:glutamine synthetase adenylyltransferase